MRILLAESTMTFKSLCSELRLTTDERTALAWHLGQFRLRKTVEQLLNAPATKGDSE